jgi:hypothetical protein
MKPTPSRSPPTSIGQTQVQLAALVARVARSTQPSPAARSTPSIAVTMALNMTLKTVMSWP